MSRFRYSCATFAVAGLATALTAVAPLSPASADETDTSLAEVLAIDGNTFDRDLDDFDALDRVVRIVLTAKPDSPVSVLTDGSQVLTAFLPTDRAVRRLARDLVGGKAARNERTATKALAGAVGVDTLEAVLLYHVVLGRELDSVTIAESDGEMIRTAQGGDISIDVRDGAVSIGDVDINDADPRIVAVDLNAQAAQIGHAIDRVLRPSDLR